MLIIILKLIGLAALITGFFILYKLIFRCLNIIAFGLAVPSVGLLIVVVRTWFKKEWEDFGLKLRKTSRILIRKTLSPWWIYHDKHHEEQFSVPLHNIKSVRIITKVNCQHVPINKDDLAEEFSRHHLIKGLKAKGRAEKVYEFDYERFFALKESYLKNKLFSEFYERYHNENFRGLGILSTKKADHRRIFTATTIAREPKIENAIKETIFWEDIILQKSLKGPFQELNSGDKVIILQLMEEGSGLLKKACDFIVSNSNIEIIGLLTFFSSLPNQKIIFSNIKEEILIELNLRR